MKWYRINVDYLSKWYDNNALNVSHPGGGDKEKAIQLYFNEIAKNEKCVDDKSIPARVDLTEYIYSKKTNNTRTNILYKNYN